jgi:transposase-like protein
MEAPKSLIVRIRVAATANIGQVLDGLQRAGITAIADDISLELSDSNTNTNMNSNTWRSDAQTLVPLATQAIATQETPTATAMQSTEHSRRPVPPKVRQEIAALILNPDRTQSHSAIALAHGISLGTVARIARAAKLAAAAAAKTVKAEKAEEPRAVKHTSVRSVVVFTRHRKGDKHPRHVNGNAATE